MSNPFIFNAGCSRYLGNALGNAPQALSRYLSTFRWRVGNELTQGVL